MRKLRDLVTGDKVVVFEALLNADRDKPRTTHHKVAKVNRVNLRTTDGRIWNRDTGGIPGHENYGGYNARAEAFDENVHPYREDAEKAVSLLRKLWQGVSPSRRENTKALALALPLLQELAEKLEL